jgi:adenosylhomocysteinase
VSDYRIKDLRAATAGEAKIGWAAAEMPVLKNIAARYGRERPLAGVRLSACLHVTAETANLVLTLAAGGATVRLCASNQLSTQDDVAAALVANHGIAVFAARGDSAAEYYANIEAALAHRPQITLDDGADLITFLHSRRTDLLEGVIGGSRGDHYGSGASACDGGWGRAALSGHRRKRCDVEALLRQSLRHGTECT